MDKWAERKERTASKSNRDSQHSNGKEQYPSYSSNPYANSYGSQASLPYQPSVQYPGSRVSLSQQTLPQQNIVGTPYERPYSSADTLYHPSIHGSHQGSYDYIHPGSYGPMRGRPNVFVPPESHNLQRSQFQPPRSQKKQTQTRNGQYKQKVPTKQNGAKNYSGKPTKSKTKKCDYRIGIWLSVIILMVIAAGVSCGIYFGKFHNSDVGIHTSIAGKARVINRNWHSDYLDDSSILSGALSKGFCQEVTFALAKESPEDRVDNCDIIRFSSGSVNVHFNMDLYVSDIKDESTVQKIAAERITLAMKRTTSLQIESRTIEFDDGDQCESNPCVGMQECVDRPYSYMCKCPTGFQMSSDKLKCSDVDECSLGSDLCSHKCTNVYGSYECSCDYRYFRLAPDLKVCNDIDECQESKHNCTNTECVNLSPGFKCKCRSGYTFADDQKTCIDENECLSNKGGCDHHCTNTIGSFSCSCDQGYFLWENKKCKEHINKLISQPLGVTSLTVLAGTPTVLTCSVPTKDADLAKLIRWTGPQKENIVNSDDGSNNQINIISSFDTTTVSSLLSFQNQRGKQNPVQPGQYTCHMDLNGKRLSLDFYVSVSDCKPSNEMAMCNDGKHCVNTSMLCDGTPNCPFSGDDELSHCPRPAKNMPQCEDVNKYACDENKCIDENALCDGKRDCEDGMDEYSCASFCAGKYQCGDKGCIDVRKFCNGVLDCKDGSDELSNCTCDRANDFKCQNGVCLKNSASDVYCDGVAQCPDRSDEPPHCGKVCLPNQHKCDGLCVPQYLLCNGEPDCDDHSDESVLLCKTCTDQEFNCGDLCIAKSRVCDGKADCENGEDENKCNENCGSNDYRCANGRCLSKVRLCNGVNDCGDWSDEEKCDCPEDMLHCGNGVCLWREKAIYHCNGRRDCPDGSDEPDNCQCLHNQFRCDDMCIPEVWRCNGEVDCKDGSDEINCARCIGESKRCSDGKCLPATDFCNGKDDCGDNSDEADCSCNSATEFSCNGDCIPKQWQCDNFPDCSDGSDELNCTPQACESGFIQCTNGRCISGSLKCDGVNDCGDYTDELGCRCGPFELTCNNGMCIKKESQCDHVQDCPDFEDELDCDCSDTSLTMRCNNTLCISQSWKCDHVADCPNGEDEATCGTCVESASEFQCYNYECISLSLRCDGITQCSDGSDEFNCVNRHQLGWVLVTVGSTHLPICSTRWNSLWDQQVCDLIGMGAAISSTTSPLPRNSAGYLIPDITDSAKIPFGRFSHSSSCSSGHVVTISCQPLACGRPSLTLPSGPVPLITNGRRADPGEWPWQVSLDVAGVFTCGGSIIDNQWVLTAAHCVDTASGSIRPIDAQSITIKGGSHLRSRDGYYATTKTASLVFIHDLFKNRQTLEHDLALIKLESPIEYNDYIRPPCLPTPGEDFASFTECWHTGWGKNSGGPGGRMPEDLHEQKAKILDAKRCNAADKITTPVKNDIMICAGYIDSFSAACSGDSGGPLVCRDYRGVWTLAGVSSWGSLGCNTFSVFTRVSAHLSWINNVIKTNS